MLSRKCGSFRRASSRAILPRIGSDEITAEISNGCRFQVQRCAARVREAARSPDYAPSRRSIGRAFENPREAMEAIGKRTPETRSRAT